MGLNSNGAIKGVSNGVFDFISRTGQAADVHIKSKEQVTGQEIIELLNAATFSATLTSNVWLSTKDLIDGLLHVHTSGTGLTSGNLTAYYSFDGITSINSETILAFTGGGSPESHALDFSDYDPGADAAGFTKNIKLYPFVTFGLTSGVDAGTTTLTMFIKAVRNYG